MEKQKIVNTKPINGYPVGTEFYLTHRGENFRTFRPCNSEYDILQVELGINNQFFQIFFKELNSVWSEWMSSEYLPINFKYRQKENKIQVVEFKNNKPRRIRGVSVCHKDDVFDFETGLQVAMLKLTYKYYRRNIELLLDKIKGFEDSCDFIEDQLQEY